MDRPNLAPGIGTDIGDVLQNIRDLPEQALHPSFSTVIPADRTLSPAFWTSYSAKEAAVGLRACLLLWAASGSRLIPREFQLEATIAMMSGKNTIIDVGTGYGKTLCMILPCLLSPRTIAVIISPLKRLQAVQVLEFERYHIKTVAINEDTSNASRKMTANCI
jgi:ATP-dependent helicase YprA (DUF1998 family)